MMASCFSWLNRMTLTRRGFRRTEGVQGPSGSGLLGLVAVERVGSLNVGLISPKAARACLPLRQAGGVPPCGSGGSRGLLTPWPFPILCSQRGPPCHRSWALERAVSPGPAGRLRALSAAGSSGPWPRLSLLTLVRQDISALMAA